MDLCEDASKIRVVNSNINIPQQHNSVSGGRTQHSVHITEVTLPVPVLVGLLLFNFMQPLP